MAMRLAVFMICTARTTGQHFHLHRQGEEGMEEEEEKEGEEGEEEEKARLTVTFPARDLRWPPAATVCVRVCVCVSLFVCV